MPRLEATVAGICLGAWLLAAFFLLIPDPGEPLAVPAVAIYSFAAVLGWLAGNLYVARKRATGLGRRGLLALYLGGPPGLIWLWWALEPLAVQRQAPLAGLWAVGVFAIFFLVPVTLQRFPGKR